MNLTALVAVAKQVDEKSFASRFPHPMLLVRKGGAPGEFPGGILPGELDWRVRTRASPFATSSGAPHAGNRLALGLSSAEPIVKTSRNPFAGMITVGRAVNNDICLPISSVSKLHAYFQQQNGKWTIRDGRSANGTFLDGRRLVPDAIEPLNDGALVAFGPDTEALFKLPGGLYAFLGQIAKAP